MNIGLFFTRAGGVIDRAVDLEKLSGDYAPHFFVLVSDDFFSTLDMQKILEQIRLNRLEAVILIGESPLNYRNRRSADLIINEIEALGINPNKIGFVNLKEQLAMVHQGQKDKATQKAKLLINAEIERVRKAELLKVVPVAPRKSVAVIGATPAGFFAAQQLLQKGFSVHMAEPRVGLTGPPTEHEESFRPVYTYVESHPGFHLYQDARIEDIYGYAGDFVLKLLCQGEPVSIFAGAIIMAAPDDLTLTREIRPMLHLDVDDKGFFKPRNPYTLQAYTSEQGIFLLPRDPSDLGRTVASADSAVLAVTELLDCPEIKHIVAVSGIAGNLCGGCGTCVKTCLFHACMIDPVKKVAVIDPKRCKGCGSCVTACPTGARDLLTYPQKYLFEAIDILSGFNCENGKVLVFLCEGCGYQALDAAASAGLAYPVGVLPLKVRCGGTIDTQLILQAFNKGFDGIVICKCQDGHCSNIVGNVDLDRRANLFREILRSRGIDTERLRIVDAAHAGENKCILEIIDLYRELQKAGGEVDA